MFVAGEASDAGLPTCAVALLAFPSMVNVRALPGGWDPRRDQQTKEASSHAEK